MTTGNWSQVEKVLAGLRAVGCREVVICPGARNAPLAVALAAIHELQVIPHFEERAAAFFALGRIKSTRAPVAVITTSGTAVAELLPATVEAFYAGLPLLLITADRPHEFRGTGAPQTIEQVGIFSSYCEVVWDMIGDSIRPPWSLRRPAHWNIPLLEPTRDDLATVEARSKEMAEIFSGERLSSPASETSLAAGWLDPWRKFVSQVSSPVVVVGPLAAIHRSAVEEWLLATGLPVYLESTSQMLGRSALSDQWVCGGEMVLAQAIEQRWVDGVIRLGGVPTTRVWRDLEEKFRDVPVISISAQPFTGLSRKDAACLPLEPWLLSPEVPVSVGARDWLQKGRNFQRQLENIYSDFPQSEVALMRSLARILPRDARVFLGNSLPIREWDLVSCQIVQNWWLEASRGANGIDGQVSTFLGFADPLDQNIGIFGDLTALYDLAAPWVLRHKNFAHLNIIVINNGGGRIFKNMYGREILENPHDVRLSSWAGMWGLDHLEWFTVPDSFEPLLNGTRVIELFPDGAESAAFWKAYRELGRTL